MQQKGDHLGPRGLINRAEYVRLIEQALSTLGYNDLASKLEEASVSSSLRHEALKKHSNIQCDVVEDLILSSPCSGHSNAASSSVSISSSCYGGTVGGSPETSSTACFKAGGAARSKISGNFFKRCNTVVLLVQY
jgi:hypothetical protein